MVLAATFAGPLPAGAVQAGRVSMAAVVAVAAAGAPLGDRAGQHHAGAGPTRQNSFFVPSLRLDKLYLEYKA